MNPGIMQDRGLNQPYNRLAGLGVACVGQTATEVIRKSQINERMDRLMASTEQLEKDLHRLFERISPVLMPGDPRGVELPQDCPSPPAAPLAGEIDRIAGHVEQMLGMVSRIIERVEV